MRKPVMKKIKSKKGYTLVELVVCFALLGIFFVAAGTALTSSTKIYFDTRKTEASFTVADGVLSEIQDDLRTMQGTTDNTDGYIKLRYTDESGKRATRSLNGNAEISGDGIEFVASSDDESAYAEQIDSLGFTGYLIKNHIVTNPNACALPVHYLTVRYYAKDSKETDTASSFYGKYVDVVASGSAIEKDKTAVQGETLVSALNNGGIEAIVARDAEQRLDKNFYQGFNVSVRFSVDPVTKTDSSGKTVYYIPYVKAEVTVKYGTSDRYTKTKYIAMQNPVIYNQDKTMYSDVAGTSAGSTSAESTNTNSTDTSSTSSTSSNSTDSVSGITYTYYEDTKIKVSSGDLRTTLIDSSTIDASGNKTDNFTLGTVFSGSDGKIYAITKDTYPDWNVQNNDLPTLNGYWLITQLTGNIYKDSVINDIKSINGISYVNHMLNRGDIFSENGIYYVFFSGSSAWAQLPSAAPTEWIKLTQDEI